MDYIELKNELILTSKETLKILKKDYSSSFDEYTNLIIDKYENQIDNNFENIMSSYNLNSLIDSIISDYVSSNGTINYDEIKSNLIKLLVNIIIELQYKNNNKKTSINNISSSNVDDDFKLMLLQSNPREISNLLIIGTTEMISRQIGEKLDINMTLENNDEYMYILQTRKFLDNDKILLNGNLETIFNNLGSSYKLNYLVNSSNILFRNIDIGKLGLSNEDKKILASSLNIKFPNAKIVEQEKEEKKAMDKLGLNDVEYVKKHKTEYVKLKDNDSIVFAEVVGNITPQERIERIKNKSQNYNHIVEADDLVDEIRKDMITSGNFQNIDSANKNNLDIDAALNMNLIRQSSINKNNNLKIDMRTGLYIDDNSNAYDMKINAEGNVELNKLSSQSGNSDFIDNEIIESGNNMNKDEILKTLESYGVPRELYENATDEQKRLIEENYGISVQSLKTKETKEKAPQFQKKLPNKLDNGYISSFIVVFTTGVLGGMIAMFLLSLAK